MGDSISQATPNAQPPLTFRWRYIILPVAALVLYLALAAFFYGRLSADVGWRFGDDGAPDQFAGRGIVLAVLLLPQLVFTALAAAMAWGTVFLSHRFKGVDGGAISYLLLVMGNMLALPQLVLLLAALDIFFFNAYQAHIPFLATAIAVMVIGVVVLGILFVLAVRRILCGKMGSVIKERVNV